MELTRKQLKTLRLFCRLHDYPFNETRSSLKALSKDESKEYWQKILMFIESTQDLRRKAGILKA